MNNNKEKVRGLEESNYWNYMKMEIVEVDEGGALLKINATEKLLQINSNIHGGVIATMIDSSISTAIKYLSPQNQIIATAQLNVNYLKPAELGVLFARSKILKFGRTIVVGFSEVMNEKDQLIAVGTANFSVKMKDEILK